MLAIPISRRVQIHLDESQETVIQMDCGWEEDSIDLHSEVRETLSGRILFRTGRVCTGLSSLIVRSRNPSFAVWLVTGVLCCELGRYNSPEHFTICGAKRHQIISLNHSLRDRSFPPPWRWKLTMLNVFVRYFVRRKGERLTWTIDGEGRLDVERWG